MFEKVWYFRKNGKNIYKDSEDYGPHKIKKSAENFPQLLSAALTLNYNIYYFFRKDRYCKRPLIVDKDSLTQTPQLDWNNMPSNYNENTTDMLPQQQVLTK